MFNLIVVVISIALLAIIAVASIFYGGDAWTQSSEKANVTTLINQGQQISGAAALYKADNGVAVATIADLETAKYLSNVPQAGKITTGDWAIDGSDVTISFQGTLAQTQVDTICAEVERQGAGECLNDDGSVFVPAAGHTEAAPVKFAFPL